MKQVSRVRYEMLEWALWIRNISRGNWISYLDPNQTRRISSPYNAIKLNVNESWFHGKAHMVDLG